MSLTKEAKPKAVTRPTIISTRPRTDDCLRKIVGSAGSNLRFAGTIDCAFSMSLPPTVAATDSAQRAVIAVLDITLLFVAVDTAVATREGPVGRASS
jgi:hypothetical protein